MKGFDVQVLQKSKKFSYRWLVKLEWKIKVDKMHAISKFNCTRKRSIKFELG